jgi:hypothetical protein
MTKIFITYTTGPLNDREADILYDYLKRRDYHVFSASSG